MAQSKKHSPLAKYNKEIPVFAYIFQRLLKGILYATHSSTSYIPLLLSFSSSSSSHGVLSVSALFTSCPCTWTRISPHCLPARLFPAKQTLAFCKERPFPGVWGSGLHHGPSLCSPTHSFILTWGCGDETGAFP